ncbi:MAG TPA: hypothetical protein VLJ16_14925, partial [Acidobacteriota bacterium]|nr:hypothetical protein [Acidobacteriota bacterium]
MDEGTIIIGAGTGGARTIAHEFQPFLRFDGRTCLEIVLDEVTRTDNSLPIYVWGHEEALKEVLSPVIAREKDRREIHIVPERSGPIESLIFTCLESSNGNDRLGCDAWSMQQALEAPLDPGHCVFYLPSDIPLISHKELDFLMKNAGSDYDLLMGWSLRNGFEEVMRARKNDRMNIDMSMTKFNFSRFIVNDRLEEARFNNIYCGRPLKIDSDLYLFIQALYQNRNLIRKDQRRGKVRKRIDLANFSRLLKSFAGYVSSRRKESGARVF